MELSGLLELGGLLLLATTKFAVAAGILVSPATNYSYLESVIILISSGFTGVLFYYYFSNWVNKIINKLFKKKGAKKRFSKTTRGFIKIKNKYGLIGISLMTAVILSVPAGSFLASRFFSKKKYTLLIMLCGIVFWAFLLPLIKLAY